MRIRLTLVLLFLAGSHLVPAAPVAARGWWSAACASCRSSAAAAAPAAGTITAAYSGRTPSAQGDVKNAAAGRNHHPYGFSSWLAGGGRKGGIAHGATDELGFHAVENRHYVTDIHATVLHQLGLDPRKLEAPGRKRLELDFGKPIEEIIG